MAMTKQERRRRYKQRYAETGRCVTCGQPAKLYMTCDRCRRKARLRSGWKCFCKLVPYVEGIDGGG